MLVLLALPAPARAAGWSEADYWRFADRMQERLNDYWRGRRGLYRPGDMASDTMVNANALLVHGVAALRGHQGPARQDDRARAIAAAMVQGPPFAETLSRQFGQLHVPGWAGSMSSTIGMQHLVVDAEVAEALATAWRARDVLGLAPELVARIQQSLHTVAVSGFWRYPAIRLNQINWYATIYSAAAEATGDLSLLQQDLHAQVRRFVRGVRRPARGLAGNLGPGMRFHYLPGRPIHMARNLDSPEYANVVASFARFWDAARVKGMGRLATADRRLLQRWMRRVLAGYWTHAGYLNWDTGFGFRRLHQAKKVGLAQQGLLAIAAGGELSPGPKWAAWAKRMLDQGFALYERWLPQDGDLPPALLFDLSAEPTNPAHSVLAAVRVQANAARAVAAGLGGRPSAEPPPLYAFDPDVGRLAVTTPSYSTAIVPVNQGGFPYGGIDIARLFDGRQEVAANVGGVPPAAFGLVVRDAREGLELATQRPRGRGPATFRLLQAPEGVGARSQSPPWRPFAAPFRTLRAGGTVKRRDLSARTEYRFTSRWIQAEWSLRSRDRRRHTAEVHFPSWGEDGAATVTAVFRDGSRVPMGADASLRLAGVAHFVISSARSGYRVFPRRAPRGALARLVQSRRQASQPRPGPTLVIALADRARLRSVALSVRLIPRRGTAGPANVNGGL
ncbi:MAG: hypothetical protein ACRDPC_06290 [Solirubrobacteraceae bacterium]